MRLRLLLRINEAVRDKSVFWAVFVVFLFLSDSYAREDSGCGSCSVVCGTEVEKMQRYKNLNNNSGISCYENGEGYIRVQFRDGGVYRYTVGSAGAYNIEKMKVLAEHGDGLNAFINRHVKYMYEEKEK